MAYRPVVLCVLDGWGIAPDGPGNAATRAHTPRLGAVLRAYSHARLDASGRAVGLPDGVMGNSEVGHLTMGAGYVQYQELVRINDAIDHGSFFRNDALLGACRAVGGSGTLHLLGLLSTGGVHADLRHLNAVADLARRERVGRVVYHCFLDGRDMPPRSALELLPQVGVPIATIHGRYWGMDRDKRWDRTERSWRAIVDADGSRVGTAEEAIRRCYERDECRDELLEPAVVGGGARVEDGDAVVFFNFRPDRARQLTWAFMQEGFTGFVPTRRPRLSSYVTMTEYNVDLPNVAVAFPQQHVVPLASILAERGMRQLHTAETEKYAHVTYFFNGGREEPYEGEDRVLVPSPKVATYDRKPEMSAPEVARTFAQRIATGGYDFAIVNFANPDMVGHTGVIDAAVRAMEATDAAVGTVVDRTLAEGGCVLLTADHGNVEEMLFPGGGVNTQHSTNPVPVALIGHGVERWRLRDGGLRDVAPTILGLLGLPVPERMTGRDLVERRS
ncbi:MAG: 2,3-bisphosphoglycerate-independent phosphoglycerate mutase [Chloroflexi bacterium]|nr:2,3-bisphosphoglycerate-independent phosphoglycerate mutase [Chloroflexota bacterium]